MPEPTTITALTDLKSIYDAVKKLSALRMEDHDFIAERERLSNQIPFFRVEGSEDKLVLTPHMTGDREHMEIDSPLRAAWVNGDEEAGVRLKEFIAAQTIEHPPLTGTFAYSQEDVDEAKSHGF